MSAMVRSRNPVARICQILLLGLPLVPASPVQCPESGLADLNNVTLTERSWCDGTLCGWNDQICCGWGEGCYTNAQTIALCTPKPTAAPSGGGQGYWVYYTSTWVESYRVTRTKTYSSYVTPSPTYVPAPRTTEKPARCYGRQVPCGPICCKGWQTCVVDGQCGSGGPPNTGFGGSYTAPLRPTSVGVVTHTTVVAQTRTVGFQPAVQTHHGGGVTISSNGGGGGLSGGAIAGIVIGVIVAIIILIILCLILCFGAAWNAILAFFGLGRRRKRTVEYEEYHRHGSRAEGRQWYGSGSRPGGRPPPPPPKKKKNDGFGWGTVILGLGALWAALGFKRRRDRKRDEKSSYTGSSGYYSDYTSSSSDRRTRDTRRSSRR